MTKTHVTLRSQYTCHPVLRHGVSFFYGTTDAGTEAGMTAHALSPRAPSRGRLFDAYDIEFVANDFELDFVFSE